VFLLLGNKPFLALIEASRRGAKGRGMKEGGKDGGRECEGVEGRRGGQALTCSTGRPGSRHM